AMGAPSSCRRASRRSRRKGDNATEPGRRNIVDTAERRGDRKTVILPRRGGRKAVESGGGNWHNSALQAWCPEPEVRWQMFARKRSLPNAFSKGSQPRRGTLPG